MRNIISFNHNANAFTEEDYKTKLIGTSDCNSYMPAYGVFAHNKYEFKGGKEAVYEWSLPIIPSAHRRERQYARLNLSLRTSITPKNYMYKLRGVNHTIQIHKGIIYKGDTILMCLGVNPDYVFNSTLENLKLTCDKNQFSLFINTELETNPIYKNIYKKVSLMYIKELKEKGVDVVYTSRINSWLFQNNFKIPKFKKVTDMIIHLKEEVPKILLIE